MNFATMLMNGPIICKKTPRPFVKQPDQSSLDQYKRLSENGIVHSRMIAKKSGVKVKSAGKQLLKYFRAGLLDKVGELEPGEYNSPIIYRWRNAEVSGRAA
jgi:hypothetical protein